MRFRKESESIYRVKLEPGDEIINSLIEFAKKEGIKGGFFYGLGAGKEFEIGWFDTSKKDYKKRHIVGDQEILSLVGNIGVKGDGEIVVHTHITIGGEDHECLGGHLFKGVISVTGEILFLRSESPFVRTPESSFGLALWEMG